MEVFDPESGALSAPCTEEIERCLAHGWSWGVTARLCNRKWGTAFRAGELRKAYGQSRGGEAGDDYYAAVMEAAREEKHVTEEKMKLILPTADCAEEYRGYRQEFLDAGDSMDGTGSMRRTEDPLEWLENTERCRHRETVPEGKVQATQFLYVRESDGRVVGMIQVRHCFNDYLEKYAGNIGYSVRPSERRRGYATRMLRDTLPFCRSIGLEKVLISCIDTNEASRRTILANGGVYESTAFEPEKGVNLERYWITL